ncbi:glycosyltransferase family 4 protein [Candidatus Falkowbacteria bacterium]|nr:glycosyltransferase family 4 protein [Candidatus Falkowbacteria bacterium]
MKILLVNKFYYLKGGSERHVFELSKLLTDNNHEVIPFSMQDPANTRASHEDYFIKPVDLEKFSLKNIFKFFHNWDAVRRLKKLVKDERPEVAHLHNINHQLTPAIIRVLKKNGIRVVMTLHAYDLFCPNAQMFTQGSPCERCRGGRYYNCVRYACVKNSYAKSLLSALELWLNRHVMKYYDQVDVFIAPSLHMAKVAEKFGLPKDRIKVLHNFLSDSEFERLSSASNLPPQEKYLFYFGRLAPEKGLADLISSSVSWPEDLKLKIAGQGPQKAELSAQIERLKVADRVELLGFQTGEDLSDLIKNALAVVLPARWPENMPYSLIEALAAGRPLLVSNLGGLPEMVKAGENGFIFKAGDINDLNLQITRLLQADFTHLSAQARLSALLFEADIYYQNIAQIY